MLQHHSPSVTLLSTSKTTHWIYYYLCSLEWAFDGDIFLELQQSNVLWMFQATLVLIRAEYRTKLVYLFKYSCGQSFLSLISNCYVIWPRPTLRHFRETNSKPDEQINSSVNYSYYANWRNYKDTAVSHSPNGIPSRSWPTPALRPLYIYPLTIQKKSPCNKDATSSPSVQQSELV